MGKRPAPRKHLLNATLSGLDEQEHFPSAEAREKAIGEIGRFVRGWTMVMGIAITVVAAVTADLGMKFLLRWAAPDWNRHVKEIIVSATMLAAFLLVPRMLHRWAREELRAKLLQGGVPVCLDCGYVLRRLPDAVTKCPECGAAVSAEARRLIDIERCVEKHEQEK